MYDVFEETPEDKERYIIDMLQRGYTYKQIMKECHVSPNTISNARKLMLGYTPSNSLKQGLQVSKETQALKLFNEGKKPIEVAIELDIATDFVFSIYQNFQRLRGLEGFISAYEYVNGNIQPYLELCNLMNGLGMSAEQVAEQVKYGNTLPNLSKSHSTLANEMRSMESQKQNLHLQINFMRNHVERYKRSLQLFDNECQRRTSELLSLESEINTRKNFIQNLENDEGYIRIKEDAKKETKIIMQNNYVLSAVTLSATIEAIRRYPGNQTLMFDIVSTQSYSTAPYRQPWIESHRPQLMQLMGNIQNEIAEQITSMIVSTMKSIP